MKTVSKINPEIEYENAKKIIEQVGAAKLDGVDVGSLDSSVDNLITAARVLMDREERRRGQRKPPKENPKPKGRNKGESRKETKKLPSERYPDLEVKEEIVRLQETPTCPCCQEQMKESGLFDTSESLEIIPKKYYIQRNKRVKFTCGKCHGSMINTPALPSIVPTSNYGDSFILDAALSKYCDLIPIERYVSIAGRHELLDLPAQSLIGLTHHLANFLFVIYSIIKQEVLQSIELLADETSHKMLEGDDTKNWYLWAFLCSHACYFEVHKSRAGEVVKNFLKDSHAEFVMSDGHGAYRRAVREINEEENRSIQELNCNAHAYRYFRDAGDQWKEEVKDLRQHYGKIYELERQKPHCVEQRKKMVPLFEEMKEICEQTDLPLRDSALNNSVIYFLNHYEKLTLFTKYPEVSLDNNASERSLRSPVVGRKVWYGTHSKRGALTNAILFSIVESCKMNGVNPRSYFPWIVERIHQKKEPLTPYQYLETQ